jgi:NAD(P)-dependent dehydrogenase (short-subunit alcohol dehydrogenase family)
VTTCQKLLKVLERKNVAQQLVGKTVAITGAGRGIGKACALACAVEGANVVVSDFGVSITGGEPSSEVADSVVEEITSAGGSAVAVASDVSTMDGGQAVVDAAVKHWGRLDAAICVAGIVRERMLFNMSEDEWDDVVRVHLKGTFTVFRHAAAVMREQKSGTLIGFTSGVGQMGSIGQANYASAKAGIIGLSRSAALGMMKYGVTSNIIAPVANTRMAANVSNGLAESGEPEDVAPMVVYLCSDAAKAVTGQVYTVVGGRISVWSQPAEIRTMISDSRWTPEQIGARFSEVGTERLEMLNWMDRDAARRADAEQTNR